MEESASRTKNCLQAEQEEQTANLPKKKIKLSCVSYIDELWFCYSPFHQLKEYYREGTFDNCRSKWGNLFDCFHLKTKREAEVQAILESREKGKVKAHIWNWRTPEEASKEWKKLFGHLEEDSELP